MLTPQSPQEAKFQQQVIEIVVAHRAAFSNIEPPAAEWLQHWLTRYSVMAVLDAIHILDNHVPQLKARYTQDSIGRAISSLLRASALARAVADARNFGGRS